MRRFHVLPISIVSLVAIAAVAFAGFARASRAPAGPKKPAVKAITFTTAPDPSQAGQPVLMSGRVIGIRKAGMVVWPQRMGEAIGRRRAQPHTLISACTPPP